MLLNRIKKTIESDQKMLPPGSRVLVGFSAGPDSTALLHALWRLRLEYGISVGALHVNHQLRGEESRRDAAVAEGFCRQLMVPFYSWEVDVNALVAGEKLSIEDAARRLRHEALFRCARENGYDLIALGHNLDDQGETVLMRFLRGSGISGLAAMRPRRADGIIRPLLSCSRKEIITYCQAQQLSYIVDSSNYDQHYLRNYLRQQLMPQLRELNPKIDQGLSNMAEIMAAEADLLTRRDRQLAAYCLGADRFGVFRLDKRRLFLYARADRFRVLRFIMRKLEVPEELTGYTAIAMLDEALNAGGLAIPCPTNIQAYAKDQHIWLWRQLDVAKLVEKQIEPPAKIMLGLRDWSLSAQIFLPAQLALPEETQGAWTKMPPWEAFVDQGKVKGVLCLRQKADGDKIRFVGNAGHKKIKEIFSEAGMPPPLRMCYPVIADSDGPVWLPGFRIADRVAVTSTTSQIIRLTITGGRINHAE